MTESSIRAITQQLDEVMAQLRVAKESETRFALLAEARVLVAKLDELILASAKSDSLDLKPWK